jgi:hypothetical protein
VGGLTNGSSYTFTVVATNAIGTGNASTPSTAVTPLPGGPILPPDPSTVAPPVEHGVVTDIASSTSFLYSGSNPIQTGVAPDTISSQRVAVLRGKVLTRDGEPLSGAAIGILGHPEFGSTLSRSDGMFDMAVNGGGQFIVTYAKPGWIAAQRHLQVPWRDFDNVPDVALVPPNGESTVIDLNSATPIQVARGSTMTDSDGTRQATLLVPQGTTAQIVSPDGHTQSTPSLTVRLTEFTVGVNGLLAMPGELPASSGYTYALDISAEEAQTAGGTGVNLSGTIPLYVDNFLNANAGKSVPLGYYDESMGRWVPSDSGRVLTIVSVTGGVAAVDVTGDGVADTGTALTGLGITAAELQQLGVLYPAGKSLWRLQIPHFTKWDSNFGKSPPKTAVPNDDSSPDTDPSLCPSSQGGR